MRFLSFSVSCRFLNLIALGVTSTNSSSAINSRARSRSKTIGGERIKFSSVPAARILLSCLAFSGFTTKSLSRECCPIIIPSKISSPWPVNKRPLS